MSNGICLCPPKKWRYNQVLNCRAQCQVARSLKAICWFTPLIRLILIAKQLPGLGHIPSTLRQLIGGQEALLTGVETQVSQAPIRCPRHGFQRLWRQGAQFSGRDPPAWIERTPVGQVDRNAAVVAQTSPIAVGWQDLRGEPYCIVFRPAVRAFGGLPSLHY